MTCAVPKHSSNKGLKSLASLKSISVVIPAYNDESTICKLIEDTERLLQETADDYEILVLNDGSSDNTLAVLEELAPKVSKMRLLNHEKNQGFGKTIKELYYAGNKDLIYFIPGDYQFAPKELFAMAEGLRDFDFVIGHRIKRNDPQRRLFQSAVYNWMLRVFYGCHFRDVNSIKLFRKEILSKITLESCTSFVDAELPIRALRAGFRVGEVAIEHLPRLSPGANGGRFSVIWDTFKDFVTMMPRI